MSDVTGETVELLQVMIRNECVNDGTAESGFERRNSDTLEAFLGTTGLDVQRFEPTPGPRRSSSAWRAPIRMHRASASWATPTSCR